MRPGLRRALGAALALLVLVALVLARGGGDDRPASPPGAGTAAAGSAVASASTAAAEAAAGVSGLPTVALAELPPEARETAALIDAGGPFPFAQDGATFENREGRLPERPRGSYREYTVVTPGEDDRGARRLVVGDDGERFYTDDHYGSFREVVA